MFGECNNVSVSHSRWCTSLECLLPMSLVKFMFQMFANFFVYNIYLCNHNTANHLFGRNCYCLSQLFSDRPKYHTYLASTTT